MDLNQQAIRSLKPNEVQKLVDKKRQSAKVGVHVCLYFIFFVTIISFVSSCIVTNRGFVDSDDFFKWWGLMSLIVFVPAFCLEIFVFHKYKSFDNMAKVLTNDFVNQVTFSKNTEKILTQDPIGNLNIPIQPIYSWDSSAYSNLGTDFHSQPKTTPLTSNLSFI